MKFCVLLFVLFFVFSDVSAKVYKWVDENGVTHYSQEKPDREVTEMKVKGIPEKRTFEENKTGQPANNAGSFDCRAVVIKGLNFMKANAKKEYGSSANEVLKMLNDPALVNEGVASCKKEMKNPKKAEHWRCQSKATTYKVFDACDG